MKARLSIELDNTWMVIPCSEPESNRNSDPDDPSLQYKGGAFLERENDTIYDWPF